MAELDRVDDLFGRLWDDDRAGLDLERGQAVRLISRQRSGIGQEAICGERLGKGLEDGWDGFQRSDWEIR